jgi:hypothetical protein
MPEITKNGNEPNKVPSNLSSNLSRFNTQSATKHQFDRTVAATHPIVTLTELIVSVAFLETPLFISFQSISQIMPRWLPSLQHPH